MVEKGTWMKFFFVQATNEQRLWQIDRIAFLLLCLYGVAVDISLAVANFAIDVAAILFVVQMMLKRQIQWPDPKLLGLLGFYLTVLALSAICAYDQSAAIQPLWWTIYYTTFPLVLAYRYVATLRQATILVACMFCSVTISSLYVIWQSYHGIGRSGFIHLLETATHIAQLSPFIIVAVYGKLRFPRPIKYTLVVTYLIWIAGLLVLRNRQTWLVHGLSVAALFVFMRISWKKVILFGVMISVIAAGVTTIIPSVSERFHSLTNVKDRSLNDRLYMWDAAWREFLDHPLLGIGPGNSPVVDEHYKRPEMHMFGNTKHPHNSFLQLLSETGLVGFAAYILLYTRIVYLLYQEYRKTESQFALAMLMSIFTVQACALTENFLFGVLAVKQSDWFLIGTALSITRKGNRDETF